MDINDINFRVKRAYDAINKRYENDVNTPLKVEVNQKGRLLNITFGKRDEAELNNTVYNQISAIASLKDHLKNYLKKNGKDKRIIEEIIDDNLELQLLIDLWNQDKHGYPLTKTNRSKKNPKIINLQEGLTIKDISQGKGSIVFSAFRLDSPDSMKNISAEADNTVVKVSGDVVDENGSKLMTLDEMIDRSLVLWEKVIKDNNIA